MEMQNRNDCLDSLLFVAAKTAGKIDIDQYNEEVVITELPENLSAKISGITKKTEHVGKGHLSFRRRFVLIAAAALLVCGLTVSSIAGKKQHIAEVTVSEISGNYVLTYDTSGIKTGKETTSEIPLILREEYIHIGKTSDNTADVYRKDNIDVIYSIKPLTKNYSLTLGSTNATEYFEIIVAGKYSGCASVTKKDGKTTSTVTWNDGKCIYELTSGLDIDELCEIAQSK